MLRGSQDGGFVKGFRQTKGGRMARDAQQMTRGAAKQRLDFDIIDTTEQSRGTCFRAIMTIFFLGLVAVMMMLKFDGEMIEPPSIDEESDAGDEADIQMEDTADKYFDMLRKDRADRVSPEDIKRESAEERKARRRQQKQAAKEAFEDYQRKYDSGECDAECRKNHGAIQLSYNQISSVVDEDYYKLLGVKGRMSKKEMKERYNDLKEKIEAGDESVKGMELQEVKEAYGVLMNNEARMYYNLYGQRPPAFMKANSQIARHPGWGQEFQTQAWKVKKLLAWLNFFDSKYVDLSVLGVIVFFSAIPIVLNLRELLQKLKEVYPELQHDYEGHAEKMEKLREEGQRKAVARPGRRAVR